MKKSTISNVIFYGILAAFLIFCTVFALSKDSRKSMFGFRIYNVLTESMSPEYRAGDMVIVKIAENTSEIKEGDVITFVPPGSREDVYLTHRVRSVAAGEAGESVFTTKGDANISADPFETSAAAIIGRVILKIPKGGGIIGFIQNNLILTVLFIISLFCLIILVRQFIKKKHN